MQSYRDLDAWKKAMVLAEIIYEETARLPREEAFGLTSQMRRAAVSIPSNLAEGKARSSQAEFLRFVSIARGSVAELETQTDLAVRFGFLSEAAGARISAHTNEIGRMLAGLKRSLSNR